MASYFSCRHHRKNTHTSQNLSNCIIQLEDLEENYFSPGFPSSSSRHCHVW